MKSLSTRSASRKWAIGIPNEDGKLDTSMPHSKGTIMSAMRKWGYENIETETNLFYDGDLVDAIVLPSLKDGKIAWKPGVAVRFLFIDREKPDNLTLTLRFSC